MLKKLGPKSETPTVAQLIGMSPTSAFLLSLRRLILERKASERYRVLSATLGVRP